PRGATPQEDAANGAALLASAKDRHEHSLVVDALRGRLSPVTRCLEIADEPELLTLSNIHHLHTPVSGTLAEPKGVLPLVELLHPTPALGGSPRALALAFIREHEPTLRGWYAAPVGWIDGNGDGAFAVAIRSAVVQEKRAWLYAGGGIVPDSVAETEWEETEWKFKPMLGVLNSGPNP
ncbi:MAG: chorismate-binding protein, partial [Caldilineaceae bacterium]